MLKFMNSFSAIEKNLKLCWFIIKYKYRHKYSYKTMTLKIIPVFRDNCDNQNFSW